MLTILLVLLFIVIILYMNNIKENFEYFSVPPVLCENRLWCSGCDKSITEDKCRARWGNFSVCPNGYGRCQDYLQTLEYGVCADTITNN